MTTLLTSELIDRCHAGSRNKGFWDERPDAGQQLMLMAGEIAEAQEADRKGRVANLKGMHAEIDYIQSMHDEESNWGIQRFASSFVSMVKDSLADELADAYIRGCDFIGGFGIQKDTLLNYEKWPWGLQARADQLPTNLGAALLLIVTRICEVISLKNDSRLLYPHKMAMAMQAIEALCEREGIDLAMHINLKLRYNSTRPAKHGKAY